MYKSLLAVMVMVFFGVNSFAQTVKTLEETVVTASKFPEKQTQLGKVITVLNDSLLRANASLTVGQLLNQQVGLQVIGSGQTLGSVQNVSTRGAGFGLTLILLDGIPVNEPSGIGSTFDINLLNTNSIDRIEILKGGQSTIYGSDAVAGVINIITKKNASKPTQLAATASYGSFGTTMLNANVYGLINKTSYEVSIGNTKSKGFSSATEPAGYNGTFANNPFNTTNFSAKITQHIDPKTSIYGLIRKNYYKNNLDYSAFVDEKDFTAKTDNLQLGTGLVRDLTNGKFQLNFLHNATERTYLDDSTYVSPYSYAKYSYSNYKSKAEYLDAYVNIKISNNLRLLAGGDFRFQNMKSSGYSYDSYGRNDNTPLDANIKNGSLYASISMLPVQKFGFELGSRLNYHSTYKFNWTYSLNPYLMLTNNLKVFTTLSTSYRNPALYNLYSPYGNTNLKPETATNFEIGTQLFKSRNSISVVFFDRNLQNVIFFQSVNTPPYGQYINQDKQHNNGVEIDGKYEIGKLNLNANYTYLTGKTTTLKNGVDTTYSNLLRRPKHALNINLGYKITSKFLVSISMQHYSVRQDAYFNLNNYKTENVQLSSYYLFNANLNYKISDKITVFANGQNLTNTKYTEIYGYKSRPISYQGGVNINL